jgi:succinyl-CoA synthetase beta subunit
MPQVIKVQIPTGGRGKAGGVKRAETVVEFESAVDNLLSTPILGYQASALLAEEALDKHQEFYLSITLDRNEQSLVLIAHKQGGVDIEQAVEIVPPLRILLQTPPSDDQIEHLSDYYEVPASLRPQLTQICQSLWQICADEDALLVEINPLVLTGSDQLVCADAKIELDDAAAFRHNWQFTQKPINNRFVILNEQGNVGCMANGAGLAMATLDAIKAAGAEPANFLDIGGGTNTDGTVAAFRKLSKLPNLQAIVVNIFGGITRCDEVAEAIVQARRSVENLPPLFIRLTGTNEAEGHKILKKARIAILPDLKSCVDAAASKANHA